MPETGIGVLGRPEGARAGRPLRRSLALLVDSFAVGLVMIAFLLLSRVRVAGGPVIRGPRLRHALAPVAFLIGLLDARLARSAVGDLFVELRADPAPASSKTRWPGRCATRRWSSRTGCPSSETTPTSTAGPSSCPRTARRTTTLIDRDGAGCAALIHDPALDDEPELLAAVTRPRAIALENARLHAELRARVDELRGSRARIIEAGQRSANGWSATCTTARSSGWWRSRSS